MKTGGNPEEGISGARVNQDSHFIPETMSWGLRITLAFIQLAGVVMIFPLLGLAFSALFSVISGAISEKPIPGNLLIGLVLVFLTGLLMALLGGAVWLVEHMKCRHSGFAPHPANHPARRICLPPLVAIAIYGLLAALTWIPATLQFDFKETYPWPLVWGFISTMAVFAARHLDRSLPK